MEHPLGRSRRLPRDRRSSAADIFAGAEEPGGRGGARAGPPGGAGEDVMVEIFRAPIAAADIKTRARELGADLVGIADGDAMNVNPPVPRDPRRPIDITEHDYKRVIVLAKHLNNGVARIIAWGDRTKFYNDELALSTIEEVSLELVYWLEDQGY